MTECPVCPCDTLEPRNGLKTVKWCPNCGYRLWEGELLTAYIGPATSLPLDEGRKGP